jgi:predicted DNA-binding transcriptional regulator AlpA
MPQGTEQTHQRENPKSKVLLSRSDLKDLGITLSNSSLLRAEARGSFPRRLRLSPATVCWDRAEVYAWLDSRRAERATWHYASAE